MPKMPGVNHLNAVRALEKVGFLITRQGKHIVMTDGTRVLSIPRHNPVNAITYGEHYSRRRADERPIPPATLTSPKQNKLLQQTGTA